jgi:hypothetical protein
MAKRIYLAVVIVLLLVATAYAQRFVVLYTALLTDATGNLLQ